MTDTQKKALAAVRELRGQIAKQSEQVRLYEVALTLQFVTGHGRGCGHRLAIAPDAAAIIITTTTAGGDVVETRQPVNTSPACLLAHMLHQQPTHGRQISTPALKRALKRAQAAEGEPPQ